MRSGNSECIYNTVKVEGDVFMQFVLQLRQSSQTICFVICLVAMPKIIVIRVV